MAESGVSSPNRRASEDIMNCSAQLYSTRSMVNDLVSIEERPTVDTKKGRLHRH